MDRKLQDGNPQTGDTFLTERCQEACAKQAALDILKGDIMNYAPKDFLVWAEIPVTDMDRAVAFYARVTGAHLTIDESGPNPMAAFKPANPETGVAGHIYPGAPAKDGAGPTVHLSAQGTLEEVVGRVWDAGGKVLGDAIEIPAGRFVYCQDPFGNSIGFFEGRAA